MISRGALALLVAVMTGCTTGEIRYPGRADVRAGDPPVIHIEPTASTDTRPAVLRVPAGTEVTWLNTSGQLVFIRFNQPIGEVCGKPIGFSRTYDGASYSTPFLPSFADARLCFARPGQYDFVVSGSGGGGGGDAQVMNRGGDGAQAVWYGTVIVE